MDTDLRIAAAVRNMVLDKGPMLIGRALRYFLDNAVKYPAAKIAVHIALSCTGQMPRVEVLAHGLRLSGAAQAHVAASVHSA